jgi:hypothetical protein
MKKSLKEGSKEAERIFHSPGPFEDRCKEMIDMLKTMSNQWVAAGLIE